MIREPIRIGEKTIGGTSVFIVAELSGNHGGDFSRAVELVRAAGRAGVDAVKLQTYRPETMTLDVQKSDFRLPQNSPWTRARSLYELYREAATPWEWHAPLFEEAKRLGLICFSSPFDVTAVELLESLNASLYKIASLEVPDIPLLKRVAATGKPVIVSNGAVDLEDLGLAVRTLREGGTRQLALLKCTASYPAPPESANLATIPHMAATFACHTGLSDHTVGIGVSVAAVAVGAKIIEKHLALKRGAGTVDEFFSLDEGEFTTLVSEIRRVEKALGAVVYDPDVGGASSVWARRSLYVCERIPKGGVITRENIRCVRPGYGLHPKHHDLVLGRRVSRDLEPGDRLSWTVID